MYISQYSDFARFEELDRIINYSTYPKFDEALDKLEETLKKCEECDGNPCYSHCLKYA